MPKHAASAGNCIVSANEHGQFEASGSGRRGYSLIELLVALALMAILAYLVVPNMLGQIDARKLPMSAQQLRGLLRMTRAHAMTDGLRYRVRFRPAGELEDDSEFEAWFRFQPAIEVEDNPLRAPGEFVLVTAGWARETTLYEPVRCARVRLGEYDPIEDDAFDEAFQQEVRDLDEDELLNAVVFEADGSSDRATFVLTREPEEVGIDELEQIQEEDLSAVLEVNIDGRTGQVWIQRPFIEVEKELFRERHIRPDLRLDWTSTQILTEDNILELQLHVVKGGGGGS